MQRCWRQRRRPGRSDFTESKGTACCKKKGPTESNAVQKSNKRTKTCPIDLVTRRSFMTLERTQFMDQSGQKTTCSEL